jgi:RNA polymerase sigma-70 factor (ECF subfamily)
VTDTGPTLSPIMSALAERFDSHRNHLLSVGYRITGSVADAEDAVQESWLRLRGTDHESIDDLRGWLTTVVGRICLDRLKSAAVRRENYVGQWLPEPVVGAWNAGSGAAPDPLDSVVRSEDARLAAMVVLDTLTPPQRVAFVLHDGFSVPFGDIASILGVTPASARQLASRARRQFGDAPDPVPDTEHDNAVTRLMAAMASGDLDRVVDALHPDCRLIGDSGGTTRTARRIVLGPDKCARFYLGLISKYGPQTLTSMQLASVNGQLGYFTAGLGGDTGFPARAGGFTVRDGVVWAFYDFANPEKLHGVDSALTAPTAPGTTPPS